MPKCERNPSLTLTFVPVSGREPVTGTVIQTVHKRPGRGYVVVQYRVKTAGGDWSPPLRECFPVVNGRIQGILERRNQPNPHKTGRKSTCKS